jgi:predicted dehydrogenase/threonine dehydrogenase-like Zn-dependent dehydrogenase
MIQLLQSLSDGRTDLVEVPVPNVSGPSLLVEGRCSVVSPGTERMLVEFGRASWLEKARSQPDKVARVVDKARTDGVRAAYEAVRARLDQPTPLGYCHAGVVVEVGSEAHPFAAGDRVVSNGPHAEWVVVPRTLAARIPDGVGFEAAAFTPLAAIALQGIRLAEPTLGETVVVYGLGLVGLLAVQLLQANGCRVIGIDTNPERLALAERFGAERTLSGLGTPSVGVLDATAGVGADAVLLTLAATSDEPIHEAAVMSRRRGRIVLVGVTGLALKRDDFFEKELSFQVSCSYGPGRYDPEYEEGGRDYPLPYVRWTEQRNMAAVLDLMAAGRVDPLPLVTHRFPFAKAREAYDTVTGDGSALGIVLEYDAAGRGVPPGARVVEAARPSEPLAADFSVGVVGAGNFAKRVLIPSVAAAGGRLRVIASAGGTSAAVVARRFGFEKVTTDVDEILEDELVDTVLILTRHDSHARLAGRALDAGKHVFVEKPLALREDELDDLEARLADSTCLLTVGFNRRFAPLARALKTQLASRGGPAALVLTVNAGAVPSGHWTQDPDTGGGRIIGEACHFLDLARFLVGAPIQEVSVLSAGGRGGRREDVASLSVGFADGSIAAIHYLANGSSAFPKERVEAFADGRSWRIDNWRRLVGFGAPGRGHRLSRPDKGHRDEILALAGAVRGRSPAPIPYDELFEVSRWAIRAAEMARKA